MCAQLCRGKEFSVVCREDISSQWVITRREEHIYMQETLESSLPLSRVIAITI